MNPNNFMLNNYIEYDGRVFQIDSISKEFPTLNTSEFGIGVVDWSNIKPIAITKEWLLKLGFELNEDYGDIKYYQIPNQRYGFGVCFDHDELKFYSFRGNNCTTLIYDMEFFQHIHHLQNLWLALTGEQLCIIK